MKFYDRTEQIQELQDIRKKAFEKGMNGHIAKPVDMTLLYNTISSLLPKKL